MTTVYFKTGNIIPDNRLLQTPTVKDRLNENTGKNKKTWWAGFLEYSANQQVNRFGWLALALTIQGCVLAPLTIFSIVVNGNSMALWSICILSFAVTEVTNLAAMPTKITIPVFFACIIADLFVIAASFILF